MTTFEFEPPHGAQDGSAYEEARDAILNDRGPLEGMGLTNDQTNAVLAILDDAFVSSSEGPADYKSMWLAAVSTLAKIDELLGLPADGCNDPDMTLSAIKDVRRWAADAALTQSEPGVGA